MANESAKSSGIMLGMIIGAAAGAVTALLFAPKSGAELRADVSGKCRDISKKTSELASALGSKSRELADAVKSEATEIFGQAKESSERVAESVKSAKEDLAEKLPVTSSNAN